MKMGRKYVNEIGNTYGRLKVIKEVGRKRGAVLYLCECECGENKEITAIDLRSGRVNSCGCLKKELIIEENTTHGMRKHRLYRIYHNMISRCYNKNSTHFLDYGGRGIIICDIWLNKETGFINFVNWSLKSGYSDNLTIDRMNVNGNYEPNNCRWATASEQNSNKRTTKYVEIDGESKTLKEWCVFYDINYKTARARIKNGWNIIDALTVPTKRRNIDEKNIL
jgi:hypothetical protein